MVVLSFRWLKVLLIVLLAVWMAVHGYVPKPVSLPDCLQRGDQYRPASTVGITANKYPETTHFKKIKTIPT